MGRFTKTISGCRTQRGQAVPIGLAAMLFATILTFALYNTAQTTSEKMRVTNAVDAATYSGLVYQARALNFQSYTNRAMVANQVSIAQTVSFVSWTRYLRIAARNLNNSIGWIPVVRPWTQAFYQVANQIQNVMDRIARIAIPVLDYLITGLSQSQRILHWATFASTQDVIREVVSRNDPSYEITPLGWAWMANNANNWRTFTTEYDSNFHQTRKANLIQRSRDGWSNGGSPGSAITNRDRGWTIRAADIGIIRIELVKGGQTQMFSRGARNNRNQNNIRWEYKAKDTLSIHLAWLCFTWRGPRTCRQEIPIGWGAAYLSESNNDLHNCSSGGWFWRDDDCPWSRNRIADRYAEQDKHRINAEYNGIRPYRDVANLDPDDSSPFDGRDPRLGLWLEVRKPGATIRTSSKVDGLGSPNNPAQTRNGLGTGMFRVNDQYAGNEVTAVSAGEVFFRRPVPRVAGRYGAQDSRDEYGNLFNPYWDVHLSDATRARAIAWAAKGVAPIADGGGAIGF